MPDVRESPTPKIYDRGPRAWFYQSRPAGMPTLIPSRRRPWPGGPERRAVYFWKISATLKNGQTIESDFAKFILQK